MKLELKHLSAYLPYKLKTVNFNVGKHLGKPLISEIIASNIMCFLDGSTYAKPILRPLSDLTKEVWDNVFVNDDIDKILSVYESDKHLGCVENYLVNILLSHHFDIFNLLENNLAIDINTLNK